MASTPLEADGPPSEAALAERYWERLRLFAVRRLGDAAAAEDVAQETLRRVIEALRAGKVRAPAALPSFIFSTALHVCLHHRRSGGREARALDRLRRADPEPASAPAGDALTALVSEERRATVRRALAALTDADREVLRLCYFEQLDTEEIAGRLGITAGAVRVRKHRALQRLGLLLDRNETTEPGT